MERILVIDDDVALCELLSEYFSAEGFRVETVYNGEDGLECVNNGEYDLIVLDIMLPKTNGFDVLRHIRNKSNVPVVMLTARDEIVDKIVGLEIGADDYLAKPFNPRELIARIRAVLRRINNQEWDDGHAKPELQVLKVGDIEMHIATRLIYVSGKSVSLTSMEFNILEVLLKHAGHFVPRDQLIRFVLGRTPNPYDRSIDVHISRLRKKLGHQVAGTERIKALRNVGYLYVPAQAKPESDDSKQT